MRPRAAASKIRPIKAFLRCRRFRALPGGTGRAPATPKCLGGVLRDLVNFRRIVAFGLSGIFLPGVPVRPAWAFSPWLGVGLATVLALVPIVGEAQQPIRIGASLSLTGAYAPLGQNQQRG